MTTENQTVLTSEEISEVEASANAFFEAEASKQNWDEKVRKMQQPRIVKSALEKAEAKKIVLQENPSLKEEGKENALKTAIDKKININRKKSILSKKVEDETTAHKKYVESVENRVKAEIDLENTVKGKNKGGGIPKEKLEKLLESA